MSLGVWVYFSTPGTYRCVLWASCSQWSWTGLVPASPNFKLVLDHAGTFLAGPFDLWLKQLLFLNNTGKSLDRLGLPAIRRQNKCSWVQWIQWVISLFVLVLLLSGITANTHRPQGVIILGIYMSSNIDNFLLLWYLSRELCRRVGLQTFKCNIFTKLSQLDVCSLLICITPFSFSTV